MAEHTTIRVSKELNEKLTEELEARDTCQSKSDVVAELLDEVSGKKPAIVWE